MAIAQNGIEPHSELIKNVRFKRAIVGATPESVDLLRPIRVMNKFYKSLGALFILPMSLMASDPIPYHVWKSQFHLQAVSPCRYHLVTVGGAGYDLDEIPSHFQTPMLTESPEFLKTLGALNRGRTPIQVSQNLSNRLGFERHLRRFMEKWRDVVTTSYPVQLDPMKMDLTHISSERLIRRNLAQPPRYGSSTDHLVATIQSNNDDLLRLNRVTLIVKDRHALFNHLHKLGISLDKVIVWEHPNKIRDLIKDNREIDGIDFEMTVDGGVVFDWTSSGIEREQESASHPHIDNGGIFNWNPQQTEQVQDRKIFFIDIFQTPNWKLLLLLESETENILEMHMESDRNSTGQGTVMTWTGKNPPPY